MRSEFTVHPKYKEKGRRIRVVDTELDFFHYLDVRSPATSKDFIEQKSKFWIDGSERNPYPVELRDYYYNQFPRQFVMQYRGTHTGLDAKRKSGPPELGSIINPRVGERSSRLLNAKSI